MKIVLTGGPSAGKTSVGEITIRQYPQRVRLIQEAASLLFRGGFPRALDDAHQRHQQLAIYYTQRELEAIGELDPKRRALICDRGSLDALAYWPAGAEPFLTNVGSTIEKEMGRYDWVIHLDTSPTNGYQTNPLRTESLNEAIVLNEKIKAAWSQHPQRFIIPGTTAFVPKVTQAVKIINLILSGFSYKEIQSSLTPMTSAPQPITQRQLEAQ